MSQCRRQRNSQILPRPYTWREPVPPPYYIALGSLVGIAAGAAIGAGCYYIWSLGAPIQSNAANLINIHKTIEGKNALDVTLSMSELLFDEEVFSSAGVELADAIASAHTAIIWSNVGYAALTGVGTVGAGFGYHYLTRFIYEDLDSILFGD